MKPHTKLAVKGVCVWSAMLALTAQSQNWKPLSAPVTNWVSVASSATGKHLFAAARGTPNGNGTPPGPVYRSDDSGATWTQTVAPITNWTSIACSGDGSVLIGSAEGAVFVSTDSSATWQ